MPFNTDNDENRSAPTRYELEEDDRAKEMQRRGLRSRQDSRPLSAWGPNGRLVIPGDR